MYRGYFHNGNFREFLHGAGGEFLNSRTGIPGGLVLDTGIDNESQRYQTVKRVRVLPP